MIIAGVVMTRCRPPTCAVVMASVTTHSLSPRNPRRMPSEIFALTRSLYRSSDIPPERSVEATTRRIRAGRSLPREAADRRARQTHEVARPHGDRHGVAAGVERDALGAGQRLVHQHWKAEEIAERRDGAGNAPGDVVQLLRGRERQLSRPERRPQ